MKIKCCTQHGWLRSHWENAHKPTCLLLAAHPWSCYNWCTAYWRRPVSDQARSPAVGPAFADLKHISIIFSDYKEYTIDQFSTYNAKAMNTRTHSNLFRVYYCAIHRCCDIKSFLHKGNIYLKLNMKRSLEAKNVLSDVTLVTLSDVCIR